MKNLNYSLTLLLFVNVDIFSDCCPKKDNYEGESSSSIDNMLKDMTKKRNTNLDDEPYKNLYDTNKLLTNYFNDSPLTGTKIEKDSTDYSKLINAPIIDEGGDKSMEKEDNVKSRPTNEEKNEIQEKIKEIGKTTKCLNNIIQYFNDKELELGAKANAIKNINGLCISYLKKYIIEINYVENSKNKQENLEKTKNLLKEQYEKFTNDYGEDEIIIEYKFDTVKNEVNGKLKEYDVLLEKLEKICADYDNSDDRINNYKNYRSGIRKQIDNILGSCEGIDSCYKALKTYEKAITSIIGKN